VNNDSFNGKKITYLAAIGEEDPSQIARLAVDGYQVLLIVEHSFWKLQIGEDFKTRKHIIRLRI